MKKISVIGAGTMGNGIAHVFALKGYDVLLCDVNEDVLARAKSTIKSNLDRQVTKGVITAEQRDIALANLKTGAGLSSIPADSDLVIEAIYKNKEAKAEIF
ncbi:MAG: 3-hydroxyacyl-CoA dehydrogenase NAD-binding domain-containing protein, partial [Syntrophothermus sp.]